MNKQEELLKQVSDLITQGEKVVETETAPSPSKPVVNEIDFHEFRIASLSYISRVFGMKNTHYEFFKAEVTHATASRTKRGLGILANVKKELKTNWLETTRGAVTKDVLTGLLRQAKTDCQEENFHAAAVLAGAVIDELLKNICLVTGIKLFNQVQGKAIAKKSLQLTGEVYKKKAYDRQTNKQIIGWIELRNEVAQCKEAGDIGPKVKQMVSGVQSFLTKTQI